MNSSSSIHDVMHFGQERREAEPLHRLAGGETQAAIRASVERAEESDDRRPPRRMSRQFDRAFDGFRPGVREKDALLGRSGRELREPLAQRGEALIVEIAAADVQKPGSRFLHRVYDFGMPVARGGDSDARHEIEEAIAVDVFHHRPLPARDRQRVFLGIRSGRPPILPFDDRAGFRSRRRDDDARIITRRPAWRGAHESITVRLCSRRGGTFGETE